MLAATIWNISNYDGLLDVISKIAFILDSPTLYRWKTDFPEDIFLFIRILYPVGTFFCGSFSNLCSSLQSLHKLSPSVVFPSREYILLNLKYILIIDRNIPGK
jgi:hypothetical protein